MARPVTIQDDVLLKAARELFLERGVRATTAEIAARAQVSPGILFKRFKSKEALFRAAMGSQTVDAEPPLPVDLDARVGKGRVEDTLVELGLGLAEKSQRFIPTLMMAWSNRQTPGGEATSPSDLERASGRAAARVEKIADYLAQEARLGRVRDGDFQVFAQTFVGALWHHAFLTVVGAGRKGSAPSREHVRRVVDTLWAGLAPPARAKR
ncbi:helix-turn-helix transcriptional regulator [Corallococcus exercitus]|uniref:Helix-turn-helix transcriptional regulator n=1 Tax=Corallococcus exercitus TaxID=2316736 RepID=A0A7Y4KE82_9BACT|nr:TetR/AcrR family transcriptional regulator [Corallococcus exercitus]NOK31635.1 helix-turn-helix transcriptional regulator [Corallococcus exercitus]